MRTADILSIEASNAHCAIGFTAFGTSGSGLLTKNEGLFVPPLVAVGSLATPISVLALEARFSAGLVEGRDT